MIVLEPRIQESVPDWQHPHGLPDSAFDALLTQDRPVIFAFPGYPQ
jgi:xylulose-5-phosphate/fructose-6-phosphate phosphoketolase